MEFSVLIKISQLLHRQGLEQRLGSRDTPAFKGRLWVGTVALILLAYLYGMKLLHYECAGMKEIETLVLFFAFCTCGVPSTPCVVVDR